MGSLENSFHTFLKRLLDGEYQHLKYPSVLRARVTSMSQIGEKTWEYSLKPLSFVPGEEELPEIPNVKSHVEIEAGVGGTAAIALTDGKLSQVVIVDEVIA